MTDHPDSQSRLERFGIITKFLGRYRKHLIIGSISLVLANSLVLINPYLIKLIIDRFEAKAAMSEVLTYVWIILSLTLVAGIFRFVVRRSIIWMSRHLEYHIRGALFAHLLKLSPGFYHTTRTGDVMARATNDLEAIRMMIGPGFMHVINTVVSLVVALGFMLYLSPRLTLYAFIPMIIFPFAVNKLGNLVHLKFVGIQEQFSRLTVAAQENLAGARVVKAYRQERAESELFAEESEEYVRLNLGMARLQGFLFPLIRFLAAGVNLVILGVGGLEVIEGTLPIGTLVAFLTYINALFWPMFAMGWVVSLYQRGTASLDRINRILNTEPTIKDISPKLHEGEMKGKIEIKNLTFAYESEKVLDTVNITANVGETIGLIGMTGAGKTTLVSLIARLYPVKSGMILIDGVDVNDWRLSELRRQIGFATQEPFLFSETVGENIKMGNHNADLATITQAAETAALDKDVRHFPKGYDTIVGERGITLSGGQKQRTAIARALIANPSILILDDVTSAVDTETEDEILRQIDDKHGHRSRIIISHRVSAVKKAHRVYFLEDGKVVESGNHEQLMALDGRYARLYKAQLLQKEIEAL